MMEKDMAIIVFVIVFIIGASTRFNFNEVAGHYLSERWKKRRKRSKRSIGG